jgi:cyclopropane fatty-acyl-phospholipid synthase-like methyltransferase
VPLHQDGDRRSHILEMAEKLKPVEFPRSASYDPQWVLENLMGPNVLWLAEALSQVMDLQAGMRILDMGCGKAVSSIFLAKEFGVQVWANDLWIDASENWRRVCESGVSDRVFPIHAEAHSLPYAKGFFDALVSLDAYHYFGTDDLYLGRFAPLVKPGGEIGIVVPGLTREFDADPPAHLARTWAQEREFWSFHSPEWWERHWLRTGLVDVEVADSVADGWRHWANWDEASLELGFVSEEFAAGLPEWIETMRIDAGRNIGFTRMVARRRPEISMID